MIEFMEGQQKVALTNSHFPSISTVSVCCNFGGQTGDKRRSSSFISPVAISVLRSIMFTSSVASELDGYLADSIPSKGDLHIYAGLYM